MSQREQPEKAVAAWVDGVLRSRGWTVLTIERTVHKCPHCGRVPTDVNPATGRRGKYHDGTSKGLPDRAYFHPGKCPPCGLVPVELKGPDTPWSSAEQQAAFEAGHFLVIRGSKNRHGYVSISCARPDLPPHVLCLARDLREIDGDYFD